MAEATGLMRGKRGLVMGVANDHSIAWGIARTPCEQWRGSGVHLSGRCAGQAPEAARRPTRRQAVLPGDVENDDELDAAFAALKSEWGGIDFLVHAIAHSDANELKGRYVDTTRHQFLPHTRASRAFPSPPSRSVRPS